MNHNDYATSYQTRTRQRGRGRGRRRGRSRGGGRGRYYVHNTHKRGRGNRHPRQYVPFNNYNSTFYNINTSNCRFFNAGFCFHGDYCKYGHNVNQHPMHVQTYYKKKNKYNQTKNANSNYQSNPFTATEHRQFMERVIAIGVNIDWDNFAKAINDRTGQQCHNYWIKLINDEYVTDPNYIRMNDNKLKYKEINQLNINKDEYDQYRRFSFVVLKDPSGTMFPLPFVHRNRPNSLKVVNQCNKNKVKPPIDDNSVTQTPRCNGIQFISEIITAGAMVVDKIKGSPSSKIQNETQQIADGSSNVIQKSQSSK